MQLNKSMHIILLTNALLVLAASVAGLFISEFYRYRLNIISTFEIAGQDIVSLLISIIFISLILKPNKTISFFIISGGFLIYIAYTYAYFSFGQIYSKLYIIYLILAGLSFYSFIYLVLFKK